ncbi:MFS transporter [Acetobacterium fimetarium]|uniref:MFS transporter n=1 Tax=Acetobacterium fimetarium TaxID=52691 RepID=A0ABR6WWJ2_9FIRM|nr:MFS transporter [Acetobacterium fimetarium]MBC3804951.1 MFS transporter [Acetobacterium fimetarium]
MTNQNKKRSFAIIMVVYLLGIFMGALDTGIVTPARTVIQTSLMVDDKTGIWMITMYTLAYAASIPVMGKLADRFGRKTIYLLSIFLFGLGSLLCGLSQNFESFPMLLAARAVQAVGGGGIVPVATAEFGTTFPKEKRGMALGLVGGVYGIANIFGASAGSAILDLAGTANWQYVFYINVPITIFILIAGFFSLPNTKVANVKKIDIGGITVVTIMVLCVLYGLKNIDFFDFNNTFLSTAVYPFLIVFVLLLPIFIFIEKRAQDPVINLSYFTNKNIVITLVLSFITGVVLMGMIFVPQFCENAMKTATGKGGYYVIILGLFAGVGAPFSGKLIDRFGVRITLGFGFLVSFIGSLFLIFVTTNYPSTLTVVISLILMGLGIGFTMGTPINYMMLDNTKLAESNSALATVSLIRSIGTAIAPAIMVGFIAHAGLSVQTNVTSLLPDEVNVPTLPYTQELTDELNQLKADDTIKDKLATVNLPDLNSKEKIEINMTDDSATPIPDDLVAMMKESDVTTITGNSKVFAERMFAQMTPEPIAEINNGIDSGINGLTTGMTELDGSIADLQSAYDGIGEGITGMESAIASQEEALGQLASLRATMSEMMAAAAEQMASAAAATSMPSSGTESSYTMPSNITGQPAAVSSGMGGGTMDVVSMIPESVRSQLPQTVLDELSDVKSIDDLDVKIGELEDAIATLSNQVAAAQTSQAEMKTAIDAMADVKNQLITMVSQMTAMKNAVPGAFETAKNEYLAAIDSRSLAVENEFQKTLNSGFKQVYMTVAIASVLALIILAFYKKPMDLEED